MHFFLCTYSLVGGKKLQKYDLVEFYCKKSKEFAKNKKYCSQIFDQYRKEKKT